MLHLENNTLARRQPLHRHRDPRLNFFPEQPPLRVQRRPMLPLPLEKVRNPFVRMADVRLRSLILGTRLTTPQMIQANVCDDAVQPRVETALEAETMQVAVNFQEGL